MTQESIESHPAAGAPSPVAPAPASAPPGGTHETPPSIWPFVLAGGIALLAFGFVSSYAFSLTGAALMALAIAGWVRELLA